MKTWYATVRCPAKSVIFFANGSSVNAFAVGKIRWKNGT